MEAIQAKLDAVSAAMEKLGLQYPPLVSFVDTRAK